MTLAIDDIRLFFVIGPLRTGSSLMARCIDDHPAAICLCESEINRALFVDYFIDLHCQRMKIHGLTCDEAIALLDKRKQDSTSSLLGWYADVTPKLCDLYGKYDRPLVGDKSPDLYRSPSLVTYLSSRFPLIYTVRDPRAILSSIETQTDASTEDKAWRWDSLLQNYQAWKPHLDGRNVLAVRYEDLVTTSESMMRTVYEHLGLAYSSRFLGKFKRPYPERFLWQTAIDWETGIRKDFDSSRIATWRTQLTDEQLNRVYSDPIIVEFMKRFGYEV